MVAAAQAALALARGSSGPRLPTQRLLLLLSLTTAISFLLVFSDCSPPASSCGFCPAFVSAAAVDFGCNGSSCRHCVQPQQYPPFLLVAAAVIYLSLPAAAAVLVSCSSTAALHQQQQLSLWLQSAAAFACAYSRQQSVILCAAAAAVACVCSSCPFVMYALYLPVISSSLLRCSCSPALILRHRCITFPVNLPPFKKHFIAQAQCLRVMPASLLRCCCSALLMRGLRQQLSQLWSRALGEDAQPRQGASLCDQDCGAGGITVTGSRCYCTKSCRNLQHVHA